MHAFNAAAGVAVDALLARRVAEDPSGLAWFDGALRLTHAELAERVARCAGGLVALGLTPGQVVTLALPDRVEFVVALLGALRAGAVVQPLDPGAGAAENGRAMADAASRLAITDARHLADCRAAAGPDGPRLVVVDGQGETDALDFAALLAAAPLADGPRRPLDAPALVLYTSGSTGAPKRIDFTGADLLTDAAHLADAAGLGAADAILCTAPLHHSYGLDSAVFLALWTGAPLCVPRADGRPFAARAAEVVALGEAAGARVLVAVPVQLDALARLPGGGLTTLRHAFSTGSPLEGSTYQRFAERFGVAVRSLYGSTEIGTMTGDLGEAVDPSTVGRPLPGVELRVVDAEGGAVTTGAVGEIAPAGAARRYAVEPEAALRDGWYRTLGVTAGDRRGGAAGARRAQRALVDLAGYKVDPREVEALLDGPAWRRRGGGRRRTPRRRRRARSGLRRLPTEALRSACRAALAAYKIPARITRLAALSRSAAGKVQRPVLVELLAARADDALADALAALPPERRAAQALAWILDAAAARLGARPPADEPLHDAGLDSAGLVALAGHLSAVFGRAIAPAALFDHPTPRALAGWLTAAATDAAPATSAAADAPDDAIAIVSLACRLPGGVRTPDELWRLLDDGVDAIGPFPSDRGWPLDRLFDPDPQAVGRSVTDRGGFIDAPGDFDPALFQMSPREAEVTDPQQRLLLELCWEAFERAGLDPRGQRGRAIGAYVGLWPGEWLRRMPSASEATEGHAMLGASGSIASGRIAYTFGLTGPALTIDTACSSSLVALHLACAALRDGTCDMALAGGATIFAEPDDFLWFSRLQALAPDGRSKAFAAGADGAGWAEGAGVVLLERLGDARENGHPVLALVRGSAINQDGRSQGLTAPNGAAQQALIRRALADAGLAPDDIDAVEAHGTGTALGDPIEAGALGAVFGARPGRPPLGLGAVKSNLGHTQAAAGIAGVMKVVLALAHERLPRTLHAEAPSPAIDWTGLSLLTAPAPWPRGARIRRAGVSSFGVSGTNAHVIIEEAPADAIDAISNAADATDATEALPLLISGHDDAALRAQAERWAAWVAAQPARAWRSIARTATTGRAALPRRGAVVAASPTEAAAALAALARGEGTFTTARERGGVVFVFPGQGSQWPGMGRALLAESDAFAEAIAAADAALAPHTGWSLAAVLADAPGAPALDAVDVVQPALFGMAYGLARLWMAAGVTPSAVVGHSQGEIAAAVVAGALSLADGALVVAARSRLVARLAGTGAMASVALPVEAVEARLAGRPDVAVAVVNSADSTAVAGDPDAVERLLAEWQAEGLFCRRIAVDYAAHSPHVDPLLPELRALLAALRPREGDIPMVSTVIGARVAGAALDAGYWCQNLRAPVRLDRALATLVADGAGAFIEPSPHPTLVAPIAAAVEAAGGVALGSLRRDDGGRGRWWRALAEAHGVGVAVPWGALLPAAPVAALPTYAFQTERFWPRPATRAPVGPEAVEHPLLDALIDLPDGGLVWTGRLSIATHPELADHAITAHAVLPGTAYLDLAWFVARRLGASIVEDMVHLAPLVFARGEVYALRVTVGPRRDGERAVAIHARPVDDGADPAWTLYTAGRLRHGGDEPAGFDLAEWPPAGAAPCDLAGFYDWQTELGYENGPTFRGLVAAWRTDEAVYCQIEAPVDARGHAVHPALLDAVLHGGTLLPGRGTLGLCFSWHMARLHATGAAGLRARLTAAGQGLRLEVADEAGRPVATVDEMQLRPVDRDHFADERARPRGRLYRMEWPRIAEARERSALRWAALDAPDGALPELARIAGLDDAGDVDGVAWFPPVDGDPVDGTARVLAALQAWLADPRRAETRLVVVTRGAIAVDERDTIPGLVQAPLWGLVASAQSEHPDRGLALLDIDHHRDALAALPIALRAGAPRAALRGGVLRVPRLAPVEGRATPVAL
ncbi:MAG: acyltransferase domain-containing protein, partial [bacterium]